MLKLPKDIYLGVGVATVSAVFLFYIIPKAVVVPSHIKIISLRPDFWPSILCIAIIVLSLLMVVTAFLKNRLSNKGSNNQQHLSEKTIPRHIAILKPLSVISVLLLYYFAINYLGIIVSSTAALLALALLYGERRFQVLIPLAILLPIALFLFFSKVANVPLPIGYIFI